MGIIYHEKNQSFHLQTRETSYIFQIMKLGYPAHLYWGKRLKDPVITRFLRYQGKPLSLDAGIEDKSFSLDALPQEYPGYGNSDFRFPAYQAEQENGSTLTALKYHSHRIIKGKPGLPGLPAVYAGNGDEAETLELSLFDSLSGLGAILSYTVLEDFNVITRSVRFVNQGTQKLKLLRALSMCLDMPDADFELIHLWGTWARERYLERTRLTAGVKSIESRRGCSSHQHNPFMALARPGTTEDHGEIYGLNLVYSGNFLGLVEVDQFSTARIAMGINPFDFAWVLEPGESFQAPEVVMVYSDEGIGGMSRTFHRLYRSRLCRGVYRDKPRPVLLNNWEATYFDFDAEKIFEIVKMGKELGIELFVLDDGWFGKRDSDNCSLGDWVVDRRKLPKGLKDLAGRVNNLGLRFGLWFEPEMVSPDSDLYREHPDWCIHIPGRTRTESRNQLVLDFSRQEVCDCLYEKISTILSSVPISYVKWDMNRQMTEIGSASLPHHRQRETAHRYMLGVYSVMEKLTSTFPHILFEGCAGGGGRFDPGILYYMPQIWTSDNTDAVARLKIQYGTSIVYPLISMGAHVSAVPNHQIGRITPLETRGHVMFMGNLGYELDPTKLSEEEREIIRKQISFYKEIRPLIQSGDLYRLLNPFEGNEAAWIIVSADQKEALATYVRILAEANPPYTRLKLRGLNKDFSYMVDGEEHVFGGDELMYAGLNIPEQVMSGDFKSIVFRIRAV